MKSAILNENIEYLSEPINKMLETGFFIQPTYYKSHLVTPIQIQKIARKVAAEQKRPFVEVWLNSTSGKHIWNTSDNKMVWIPHPETWMSAVLSFPRRKYTSPLITPLSLPVGDRYDSDVTSNHQKTYWCFTVRNQTIWSEYYEATQTRPEMRKALRLPPL
jgi:hypothetical protein